MSDGSWPEYPVCKNVDDCSRLKHGCGAEGICVDGVDSYHCDCEESVDLHLAEDGSGEWVCGGLSTGVCEGHTCGAHGICVDLTLKDSDFDSGPTDYRCSCVEGYYDNGTTCEPLDCGERRDKLGVWQGETYFGGELTLTCADGSFVDGGNFASVSVQCPATGQWPVQFPTCVNAWNEAQDAAFATYRFWMFAALAMGCVICAALAAGLTMGLVNLDDFEMSLLMETKEEDCESDREREELRIKQRSAARVAPLLQDHHRLLVTLLLLNSLANEALPLFLDQLVPSIVAVLLSVSCVLFFGEILPSAVFTGPQQLWYAAAFAPVVRVLEVLFWVVARPVALVLDRWIGHAEHGPKYNRAELASLLALHQRHDPSPRFSSPLSDHAKNADTIPLYSDMELQNVGAPDDNSAGERYSGLHPLECSIAKRAIRLSTIQLHELVLPPLSEHASAPAEPTTNSLEMSSYQLRGDMSVAAALELLQAWPIGSCASIVAPDGSLKSRVSLETLLCAALLPSGI